MQGCARGRGSEYGCVASCAREWREPRIPTERGGFLLNSSAATAVRAGLHGYSYRKDSPKPIEP